MKTKLRSIIFVAAMGIAFALPQPWPASGAMVITQVPGSYVWDGRQYVGMVGNQYLYLAPGNVWRPMDPGRMSYFRGWQRAHPNWRTWATPNVRYRTVRPGRPQPVRGAPPGVRPQPVPVPVVPPPPPPGTRSGGRPRSSRSRPNPYTIPRLIPSPGGPAYWR